MTPLQDITSTRLKMIQKMTQQELPQSQPPHTTMTALLLPTGPQYQSPTPLIIAMLHKFPQATLMMMILKNTSMLSLTLNLMTVLELPLQVLQLTIMTVQLKPIQKILNTHTLLIIAQLLIFHQVTPMMKILDIIHTLLKMTPTTALKENTFTLLIPTTMTAQHKHIQKKPT
jgi:hypothetical protein